MTIEKVCVLGAPADQGQPLVQELLEAGFQVTAGVRRDDAMKDTPFPDLPTVHADITDADAMASAFAGQDAAAFHLPFEFDRDKAANFGKQIAEGAKRAGLKKIVFNTACFVADHDLDLSAHDGRRDIERALRRNGHSLRLHRTDRVHGQPVPDLDAPADNARRRFCLSGQA